MRTLYKDGKQIEVWGLYLDYVVVDDSEVDSYISNGWRLHPMKDEEQPKKRGPKAKGDRNGKDEG